MILPKTLLGMMKKLILSFLWLGALACKSSQFTTWQVEAFEKTPITQSVTKTISLRNEFNDEQKILGVGFDSSGDGRQHFRIDKVMVGNRPVGLKKIIVPPGSSLNIQVTYEPRNLETTQADFGGWVTGEEKRFVPYKAGSEPEAEEIPLEAIHRIVFLSVYETPRTGMVQIEFVGKASEGPNGEIALPETGAVDCEAGDSKACFTGTVEIDVPELFKSGPMANELLGPIPFMISGSEASLRMELLPPIILLLKGNGPGEPLEGQPISAASIVIRGVPGEIATGIFDGSQLELADLDFRVQVMAGEIKPEDITAASSLVDFKLEGLTLITEEPLTDGALTLLVDTTLSTTPSGSPIFDQFLGGARIMVRFRGNLAR